MSRTTVSALDRGLAVLEAFHPERRVLGASELARLTGIPRPTVVRLAATLLRHRWLALEPGGERFQLGPGVVSLARVFLAGLDVRAAARGPMQALAERSGGSVYLALRDGVEMVLVEACRPRAAMLAARLDVGSRVPLPQSALGRAYLAAVGPEARAPLLQALERQHGSRWSALSAGLEHALADFARHGTCLSAGEFHPEINSVATALVDARGEVLALNAGGPAFAFDAQRLRTEVAPALRAAAQEIAAAIGGHLAGPAAAEVRS
jgi:DNA-binding IclR family transcriptional regulator